MREGYRVFLGASFSEKCSHSVLPLLKGNLVSIINLLRLHVISMFEVEHVLADSSLQSLEVPKIKMCIAACTCKIHTLSW